MAVAVKIKGFKMKKMRFTILSLIAVLGIFVIVSTIYAVPVQYLKDSKHNLSNWGPGPVKATTETQVCIFCHAPHNADSTQAPLWSHADQDASVTFQMASTVNVSPGRSWADATPTGVSKKCLSCHDGTVALGALANGATIAVTGASGGATDILYGTRTQGGGLTSPPSPPDYGFIGTDLRGGHVISFDYNAFYIGPPGQGTNYYSWNEIMTADPKNIGMFDRYKKMQCHTCHDPHNDWCDDNPAYTIGKDPLWRKPCGGVGVGNRSVCDVCHKMPPPILGFKNYSF